MTSHQPADANAAGATERLAALPGSPAGAAAVPKMFGYRTAPMPGVHRGLPSPYLTVVFSLSGPIPIEVPVRDGVRSGTFRIPVGGLHTRPVLLPQPTGADGPPSATGTVVQSGIQLAVHPLAARALFGMPASELTRDVLELDDVIGRRGDQLRERLSGPIDPGIAARLVSEWIDQQMAGAPAGHPSAELIARLAIDRLLRRTPADR